MSPGDTLRYTVALTVAGDSGTNGTSFVDTPDGNTTLVAGSVTTTIGVVTAGNTSGDSQVAVDLGDLNSPSLVTITFDVLVNDPLVPAGTTQLVNQGRRRGATTCRPNRRTIPILLETTTPR